MHEIVIFKSLSGGHYCNAKGTQVEDHGSWIEVENISVLSSINNVKSCSHRVSRSDILYTLEDDLSIEELKEKYPELFDPSINERNQIKNTLNHWNEEKIKLYKEIDGIRKDEMSLLKKLEELK